MSLPKAFINQTLKEHNLPIRTFKTREGRHGFALYDEEFIAVCSCFYEEGKKMAPGT